MKIQCAKTLKKVTSPVCFLEEFSLKTVFERNYVITFEITIWVLEVDVNFRII